MKAPVYFRSSLLSLALLVSSSCADTPAAKSDLTLTEDKNNFADTETKKTIQEEAKKDNCDPIDSAFAAEFEKKFDQTKEPILLEQTGCNGFPDLDCARTVILKNGDVIKGVIARNEKVWHDKVIGKYQPWFITQLQCKLHHLRNEELTWTDNANVHDGPSGSITAQNSDGIMVPLFKDSNGNAGNLSQYQYKDALIKLIEPLYLLTLSDD